jgi:hypothetical protein
MQTKDKVLCLFYALVAVGALFATWSNNLKFFAQPDNGGIVGFFQQASANPAAASISNDLTFMCIAAFVFMVLEARKLGIRFVWLYIVLSCAIAVSVMFPLFLLARQVKLAKPAHVSGASV